MTATARSRGHLTAVPKTTGEVTPAGNVVVDRFTWERMLRRAPLPTPLRMLAMTLGTYADQDGTEVRPGDERVARVLRCDPRTIRRNRRRLVDMGLIERTSAQRVRGRADVYRLTIPADFLEWPGLLGPDEEPYEGEIR
ncbi:hypothetical protein JL108_14405 [Aeromicrobium sp. YIM 150415]|uniref:helix-turn-helix domain-containing protein n=1 Tax=Aeromicrobium sp. YIM 150415 TaxID=2803912 RepID=UPI001963D6E5|nr:helix-turn-helix domain-containing protein [Aeromicrobium sp. YIM 150415]MBM9464645.1 hypothetical protein [Aeromicrobium sp. YIM 150415]